MGRAERKGSRLPRGRIQAEKEGGVPGDPSCLGCYPALLQAFVARPWGHGGAVDVTKKFPIAGTQEVKHFIINSVHSQRSSDVRELRSHQTHHGWRCVYLAFQLMLLDVSIFLETYF